MFISIFGLGMSNAMPDVCMTPPLAIPAPFPNIGTNAMAIPGYFTIMINCMPELNVNSMYAMTSGDELGTLGGVASGVIMGPGALRAAVDGGLRRRSTGVAHDGDDDTEPEQRARCDLGARPDRIPGAQIGPAPSEDQSKRKARACSRASRTVLEIQVPARCRTVP